jgi:hypothetical protein
MPPINLGMVTPIEEPALPGYNPLVWLLAYLYTSFPSFEVIQEAVVDY